MPASLTRTSDNTRRRPHWRFARLLAASAVVLPLAIFLTGAITDYRQTHQFVRSEVVSKAEALAEHASAVLQMVRMVLARVEERVGDTPWPEIRQSADINRVLKTLATDLPEIEAIYLAGPDGTLASSSREFPTPPIDISERDYFRAMRDDNDDAVYVSAPFRSKLSGTTAFSVSRRLKRTGGFDGGVGVILRPAYFQGFFRATLGRPHETTAALLRTDGTVLVRYPAGDIASAQALTSDALRAALASDSHAIVFEGRRPYEGATRISAYRRVAGLPLAVVYSLDGWAIYGPWLFRLAALGSFAILTGATLFWASRRAMREAESELDLGRAQLEGVVRAMPIGVIVAEAPSGRLLLANDQVLRLLRGPAAPPHDDDVETYTKLVGYHPDGRRLEPGEWPLARAIHGEAAPEEEISIVRSDGSRGIIAISSAPVRNRGGTVIAAVVALYDLTARRESQARVELLMRETLHRAKNQLAVVEGMARQTGRIVSNIDDFLAHFSARLQGLALTQTLLVDRQWASVRLSDLLLAQLKPFGVPAEDSIAFEGPSIEVAPEPAQNLGLAFHELASNAIRYGALSNGEGRITVKWGAGDQGRFWLEWIEQGGPPIEAPPVARGFGSMVLTRIAGAAVDGTVTMEFNRTGLIWRLDGNARYFS